MSDNFEGFEIGNVYTKRGGHQPPDTLYMAINKKTLVTCVNGKFGRYTTRKKGHSSLNISVSELCEQWKITLRELDNYMYDHFQPDEPAKIRAREEKFNKI